MPGWWRRGLPDFTIVPADVIIYRKDKKAVAVDGRTKERIIESENHAEVIQKAIDVIDGGRIIIEGEYKLHSPINIDNKYIEIVGSSREKTILRFSDDGFHISKSMIVLASIKLYGSGSGTAILADDVKFSKFENLDVINFDIGLYFRNRCYSNKVVLNRFHWLSDTAIIMENDVTSTTVIRNEFINNMKTAIKITRGGDGISRGNVVIGNWFEPKSDNASPIILIENAHHNIIAFNYFTGSDIDRHIYVRGSTASATRNIIAFNTIIAPSIRGIIISGGLADENVVIGNTIIGTGSYGIVADASKRNIIIGNVVSERDEGISLWTNTTENIIQNNMIAACKKYGIRVRSGCDYNTVVNNKVINSARGIVSESKYNMIVGNYLKDNSVYNMSITETENMVRQNYGYVTENSGVATLPAGSTSVTVNHGLATTPSKVLITPLGQPPGKLWVENITDTSFNIVTDTAPSVDLKVAWYAEV